MAKAKNKLNFLDSLINRLHTVPHRAFAISFKFEIICGLAIVLPQCLIAQPLHAQSKSLVPELQADSADVTTSTRVQSEQIFARLSQLQEQVKERAYPISLEAAVATGLRENPELLQAFNTIQQFEWQLISAQRQWYPTLQLNNGTPFVGASWNTFVNDNYAISSEQLQTQGLRRRQATKTQQNLVQPGVIANWNLIDPTRQPSINSAVNALQQQKYLFDVSARNLILNIQQAYFSLQSSQQLIDSFQQIYAINKQQLNILEARRAIGMVTVLELEQTRSQLFVQLNQLILYTQNYIDQSAALAQALSLPQDQLAIPADPAGIQSEWKLSLEKTISLALKHREEIHASISAAEAAEWSAVAAIRSYLPIFSLVATGNLTGSNGYEAVPVSMDAGNAYSRNRNWSAAVGIGFQWSLFDGGVQASNAQAAKARARMQQAKAATTEFQVVRQVRTSYGQMQTSLIAMNSAENAYRSAQLAQDASRARFDVGIGDITSVVQTIQQLSQSAEQRAQALLSYNDAVSQLYRYSATWPVGSEKQLDERIEVMRKNQRPSSPSRPGVMP